jgi:GPH family glycoside/pentoside/hexuronide:cation symporter
VLSGIAVGTDLTIPASMVADLGEKQGSTGAYFGIWNLVAKVNLALAAGVALPLLAILGYEPGNPAHPEILIGAYVLLPLALKTVAVILLCRWRNDLSIEASDGR